MINVGPAKGLDRKQVAPAFNTLTLGVTLYEMLTGELPFTASDTGGTLEQMVLIAALPPVFAGIILAVRYQLMSRLPHHPSL